MVDGRRRRHHERRRELRCAVEYRIYSYVTSVLDLGEEWPQAIGLMRPLPMAYGNATSLMHIVSRVEL